MAITGHDPWTLNLGGSRVQGCALGASGTVDRMHEEEEIEAENKEVVE